MTTAFALNGEPVATELPPETPLIHVLRDGFGLFGTRWGCGAEACGACLVLLDGRAVHSCTLALDAVAGRGVRTVEGLGTPAAPHPLQAAFLEEQAGQCGYCLSGILVRAAALLAENPDPDAAAVRAALDGNLCRCGAHNRIVRAVLRAAAAMRAAA
ncbi:(2Fe-2S)-binding protein [Muricoccus radiodurans]|uniref:(2Fe-2S)-binding protein n=1 Tax=Muricoccus radiodurans TaxID=2231721 RepID=UPI003CF15EF2